MAGSEAPVFRFGDVPVGITICEDIWYPVGPATLQALAGARLILNLNASPYQQGKWATRETMLATRAMDNDLYVAYVNLVGGQDELVFDGGSVIFGPDGQVVARAPQFSEHLLLADLDLSAVFRSRLRDPLRRKERLLEELRWRGDRSLPCPPFPPLSRIRPCPPPPLLHRSIPSPKSIGHSSSAPAIMSRRTVSSR